MQVAVNDVVAGGGVVLACEVKAVSVDVVVGTVNRWSDSLSVLVITLRTSSSVICGDSVRLLVLARGFLISGLPNDSNSLYDSISSM